MNFSDAELLQLRDRVIAVLEQHPAVVALTPLPAAGVVGQTIQVLKDFIGKPDNHLPQLSVVGGSLCVAAGLRVAATSPAPQLLDELAAAVRRELAAPVSSIGSRETASGVAAETASGTTPVTDGAAAEAPTLAVPALNPADIQVQLVATSIDQTGGAA